MSHRCDCAQCKLDIHSNRYYCMRYKRKVHKVIDLCKLNTVKFPLKQTATHCPYCGKKMSSSEKTIDHITAKRHGGGNDLGNLVVCCKKCNGEKDDLPLKEFRKTVDKAIIIYYLIPFYGKGYGNYALTILQKFKIPYSEYLKGLPSEVL